MVVLTWDTGTWDNSRWDQAAQTHSITATRTGDIIDALIAQLNASSVFASPVRVFDGPDASQGWADAVFVGFDGDWQGTFESVQIAHTMSFQAREFEELQVAGCVVAWSGALDVKACRDRAVLLLAGVDAAVRADPSLGLTPDVIANIDLGTMFQEPYTEGFGCRITFTVNAKTYLNVT